MGSNAYLSADFGIVPDMETYFSIFLYNPSRNYTVCLLLFFDSTFHASSDIASTASFTAASASDASSVAFVVAANAKM